MSKGEKIAAQLVIDLVSAAIQAAYVVTALWMLDVDITLSKVWGILLLLWASQIGLPRVGVKP